MAEIQRSADLPCSLLDKSVQIYVHIDQNYATEMDFTLAGRPYTFRVTAWHTVAFHFFLVLFHQHTQRDPGEFGVSTKTEDGFPDFEMNVKQMDNAILQACKDVMFCLDEIAAEDAHSVLDYALWYREKGSRERTYSKHIARVTCNCVVDSHFVVPDIEWEEVVFD